MIRLSAVDIGFEAEPPVLSGIDLTFEPGALAGLIGPPGSGKSVLLKVIAGLLRPAAGQVHTAGVELAQAPEAELRSVRKRIGMVFQNNALFDSLTIFDNVAFPLRRADEPPPEDEIAERVRRRLQDVGLKGSEALFPHELSGGMQKRAGIARATVASPQIRLYDEPTAGLDPVTSARILRLIAELHAREAEGVSIVVSNEMDTLLRAVPRLVMLYRGTVAYDGAAAEAAAHSPSAEFVRGDVGFGL